MVWGGFARGLGLTEELVNPATGPEVRRALEGVQPQFSRISPSMGKIARTICAMTLTSTHESTPIALESNHDGESSRIFRPDFAEGRVTPITAGILR